MVSASDTLHRGADHGRDDDAGRAVVAAQLQDVREVIEYHLHGDPIPGAGGQARHGEAAGGLVPSVCVCVRACTCVQGCKCVSV